MDDRLAVARRLGEADGARDHCFENDVAVVLLDLGDDLVGVVRAHVHRHQDAAELEIRVRAGLAELLADADDLCEALEAVVFALERDDDFVRGAERVRHEHAERRRAVEDDEIERRVLSHVHECFAEAREVIAGEDGFDFHAREVEVRGDEPEIWEARRDHHVGERGGTHHRSRGGDFIHGLDADAAGGVCLRIEVHE